jgi:hypothetical protein
MTVGPLGANPNNSGGTKLGGGITGISATQTITNYKDSEQTSMRSVLRNGWNTLYATGNVNGYGRVTTPFRAIMNSGDYLGRVQYSCGGPNPTSASKPGMKSNIGTMWSNCDSTEVPASSCNVRFVADSSDYTKFRKQQAHNHNYNDSKNGGDQSNASYVPLMRVRRF